MHKAAIDPYRVGQPRSVGVIDPPASFDGLEAAHGLQAKGRMKMNEIIIDGSHRMTPFKFDYLDKTPGGNNLGRAMFTACVKYRKNRVSEFWVFAGQIQDIKNYWHYIGGDIDFTVRALSLTNYAHVWRTFWCEQHKTQSIQIYPPDYAKFMYIDNHGIEFWGEDLRMGDDD